MAHDSNSSGHTIIKRLTPAGSPPVGWQLNSIHLFKPDPNYEMSPPSPSLWGLNILNGAKRLNDWNDLEPSKAVELLELSAALEQLERPSFLRYR